MPVGADLPTLVNLGVNGVAIGFLYFMVAAGLSLIFGLMHVLNFAHGAMFVWGAYGGMIVWKWTGSFPLALLGGAVAGAAWGAVTEYLLVRPLYRRPIFIILLTLGLSIVLEEIIKVIWGPNVQDPVIVPGLDGSIDLVGQQFPAYRLFVIGLGLLMLVTVLLLLNRTRLGIIIRAGVQDREMVQALGIDVRRIFTLVFALGAGLAGLAGFATAPFEGIHPYMGHLYLLRAFVVVVIGGFGSYAGTAAASVLLGMSEQIVGFFFPRFASGLAVLLMAVVLLIRPEGLFKVSGRRAS
jgi:branched-chain amino acid transport system permease protein